MKLSDAIGKYLVSKGVKVIFGYQGGAITHMIDSFDKNGISYIQSYNEQGAGMAADAYARVSELGFGVAIGTNGPGATNLITAIANAYCDSIPVLFFTGQVHTFAMKKRASIRQESFQEIDILSMVRPITKYCVTIMDKNRALSEIDKALKIALEGRKGPVLVDIPVDVQGQDVEYVLPEEVYTQTIQDDSEHFQNICDMLRIAERPLVIAGGGIRNAGAVNEFREMINTIPIPVVSSLMGLDVLPHDNECFVGYIGSYGNRYANFAVQNADLILAIGTRLDLRQTGKRRDLFAPKAKLIHIDIDENELGHFVVEDVAIKCDIKHFLIKFNSMLGEINGPILTKWKHQIEKWKIDYPSNKEFLESKELNPNLFLKKIGKHIPSNSVITFDVGQNQMWSAQSLRVLGDDIRILNSGGLGAMGYSLPASIGAYFAQSAKKIIALMGDGGLQMNIQELQMIAHHKIPIKVFVFKNNALGLIRDIHEKYYYDRYVGSVDKFSVPPLDRISVAYGMKYYKIIDYADCDNLEEIIRDNNPWLIEIEMNSKTYVRPELLGSDSLDRQSPYVDCCERK